MISDAPTSPFAEYLKPPRPSIVQLLAWAAVATLILAIDHLLGGMYQERIAQRGIDIPSSSVADLVGYSLRVIHTLVIATTWVGAGVILRAKLRGVGGRLQPGHWLLLIVALKSIIMKNMQLATYWMNLRWYPSGLPSWMIFTTTLIPWLGFSVFYAYVAWRRIDLRYWRIFFYIAAAVPLVEVAVIGLFSVVTWSPPYAAVSYAMEFDPRDCSGSGNNGGYTLRSPLRLVALVGGRCRCRRRFAVYRRRDGD